jgi:hypothetical protein
MSEIARRRKDCAAGAEVVLPSISIDTLLFCLARLNGKDASVPIDHDLRIDLLSTEQLVEIGRDNGWDASPIHLAWPELRASLANARALLVLKNGNVVLAIANNPDAEVEEIVVSDPLYSGGADFFLPRTALEPAWGGITLPAKPLPSAPKPLIAWLARFGAGIIMTGPVLLYPSQASVDQSTASLFTSTHAAETQVSPPKTQQVGVGAGSAPLGSRSTLLLLTKALNTVRKHEVNTSDAELGATEPVKIESNGSSQLNLAVAADVALASPLNVPRRQSVTILRGAGTRH